MLISYIFKTLKVFNSLDNKKCSLIPDYSNNSSYVQGTYIIIIFQT